MARNDYDNDFESDGDEEIVDDTPFEVNVTNLAADNSLTPGAGIPTDSEAASASQWDSDDEGNELELHGRGGRMKLSKKPPEVLLRQYRNNIGSALDRGDNEQAIEDLVRCTALARIIYGDCDWRFAESEAQLANAYWKHRSKRLLSCL